MNPYSAQTTNLLRSTSVGRLTGLAPQGNSDMVVVADFESIDAARRALSSASR